MKFFAAILLLTLLGVAGLAQDETTAGTASERSTSTDASPNDPPSPGPSETPAETLPESTPPKRGLIGRILHPFGGGSSPTREFRNPKFRGLVLELELAPQPLKLSETRQISVKFTLTNKGKKAVNLDFPTEQRIDIHLMNSGEVVLTKWSENRVFKDKPGTLLINSEEHVEYNEKISTRELAPDKVYIVEAFFPKYPELRARQKFMTAP